MNGTIVNAKLEEFERAGRNLWKAIKSDGSVPCGTYFRLSCVAPVMLELIDIDVATGRDIYGEGRVEFETGTFTQIKEV